MTMRADTQTPEPTISALNAAIRLAGAPEAMRADLRGWLQSQGVAGDDLDAMLAVGAERILLYRQLVHNRMRNATRAFIARTAHRLGMPRLRTDFDGFMEARAASSYYLRDIPSEFVGWVIPRWREDDAVADYLPDLARHELLDYDVRNHPAGGEEVTGKPVALDQPLSFDGAARRVDYDFAVHRLPISREDETAPDREPTRLLVYRDESFKVRYLELIPFAAVLLDALLGEGLSLQQGVVKASASVGEEVDDHKLGQAATLLADLAERKVMLGGL